MQGAKRKGLGAGECMIARLESTPITFPGNGADGGNVIMQWTSPYASSCKNSRTM